jgi:hypothetical protein
MQFNDKKSIKNLLENVSKSQQQKTQQKTRKKLNQIIRNNDFFFKNEISSQQKIKQIPDFYTRYYIFQYFSPIKIGEFRKEQYHLENYEDISNQLNEPQGYALVTYPFLHSEFYPDFNAFFSPLTRNQNPKFFFHYFFSSYIHLIESILLLNEKDIYPFLIKEETIFLNGEKIPILSLSSTISLSSNIPINELLLLINHLSEKDLDFLPVEFQNLFLLERENPDSAIKKEKMANECILTIPNLNNYQLSLLYLKQLDKIRENNQMTLRFMKFQNLLTNLYECFQNVVNTKSVKRENLRVTKEKIENLFLGFS